MSKSWTGCRRSPIRERWECMTWPDKPTANPCAHDHTRCDSIGCVEHVDFRRNVIVHLGCDREEANYG